MTGQGGSQGHWVQSLELHSLRRGRPALLTPSVGAEGLPLPGGHVWRREGGNASVGGLCGSGRSEAPVACGGGVAVSSNVPAC